MNAAAHPEDEVFTSVCNLFGESQFHVSSHRKNIQALRKLHSKIATAAGLEGESVFLQAFCHCLHVLLNLKKNDETSSRLIRFLVGFIVRSAEAVANSTAPSNGVVERFIESLMSHVLDNIDSKEKLVRSRLCQVMVACLNSVQELSDDIWSIFRIKMTERLFDKEAIVRVQAIHAMARLQSLPVDDSSDFTILDIFIDLLQHDPSADVRKAALLQVDVTPKSLPFILERLRDVDSVIRRLFFSKRMAEIDVLSLSIQQRDEILRAGLMDREAPVRQACSDMIFEHWIQKTDGNLIQFLAGLDVLSNTEIAEVALKNFFEKLPDMLTDSFTSQFLESMTVEMAFVLRVYCEHQLGLTNGDAQGIQDALPELSVMAQYVRGKYDAIVTCSDDLMRTELEFVLNELLKVCFHLDYSDEVGRRSIFEALQEIMSNLEIGTGVFETCIKIFAKHSSTISEFLSSMTEFVGGFRDVYESPATGRGIEGGLDALKIEGSTEEEPPEDGISDEIRIMANLKALEIIRNILCNPEITSFGKQPILVAYLDEIVIPSVNSGFATVQAAGLKSLGLCCTIEKELAGEYMQLFCDFYRLGHEEGRKSALQIVFDLVFLYGREYFDSQEENAEECTKGQLSPTSIVTTALYDPEESVQLIAAEGFAKLLLHRVICDEEVLEGLFYLYLYPGGDSGTGAAMKQCLSYFFQSFAFTAHVNQLLVGRLVGRVLRSWIRTSRTMNGTVSLPKIGAQLLYLVERTNLVPGALEAADEDVYDAMYAQIGCDLCWTILADPQDGDSVRPLVNMLVKLPLKPLKAETAPLLKQLLFLQTQLLKYVNDKTALTGLKRFSPTLLQLDTSEEPLEFEVLNEMKAQLGKVLPTGMKANVAGVVGATSSQSGMSKKARMAHDTTTGNIMDEISDLLEGADE